MNRRLFAYASLLPLLVGAAVAACGDSSAPQAPQDLSAQLEKDTGSRWVVDNGGRYGTPDLISPVGDGPILLHPGENAAEVALKFLEKYQSSFGTTNLRAELREAETDVDAKGATHVRFDQVRGAVPVFGAGLSVHFKKNGALAFVNGDFVPKLAVSTSPTLDEAAGRAAALRAVAGAQTATSAELVVEPYFGSAPVLAWRVTVSGGKVAAAVFVDATSGQLRVVDSQIKEAVSGSGLGARGYAPINDESDRKYFDVTESKAGTYEMIWPRDADTTRLEVRSGGKTVSTTDINSWDPVPAGGGGAGTAVDAYYHLHLTDQFYRSNFRWKSFDNKSSPIVIVVHDNAEGAVNAFWDGTQAHFGDGDVSTGGKYFGLSNLDVSAHELTHAVTQYTSKLVYAGESGALNESFSDVFGSLVEHANAPDEDANMKIAEGCTADGTPFRSMLHPASVGGQPDHVTKQTSKGAAPTKDNDWGGVHGNSGIPNNAFALMVAGGKNDTSGMKVDAGGWDLAQQVWWFAQRYNDRAATDFYAHARWMVAAAVKLDLDPKPVACAWVATGVLKEEYVKSKWNVTCGCPGQDGGTADAGACCAEGETDTTCCTVCPVDGGGDGHAPDTCAGKSDGFYCSEVALYSGYSCQGGSITGGQQCEASQKCGGGDAKGNIICK